ncbi:MAG: hypothetical protein DMG13_27310 [Acidobacteria bacterium]|nr:MAG: hypothetical protein DMG13_27310 [Acidobacteriota bacterium]
MTGSDQCSIPNAQFEAVTSLAETLSWAISDANGRINAKPGTRVRFPPPPFQQITFVQRFPRDAMVCCGEPARADGGSYNALPA